jgi:hypothetical protein
MSIAAKLVIVLAILIIGFAGGIKWHVGIVAQRELQAQHARASDAIQQRKFIDIAAGQHAEALDQLNDQLGDAREQIARLSGRSCLDARTVRVLNSTGLLKRRAAASEPQSPPETASSGTGIRFSTERDVAGYIALCRTRYAEVSDQLNQILDIEDRRYPPASASP